jgi:hypothetical protein
LSRIFFVLFCCFVFERFSARSLLFNSAPSAKQKLFEAQRDGATRLCGLVAARESDLELAALAERAFDYTLFTWMAELRTG